MCDEIMVNDDQVVAALWKKFYTLTEEMYRFIKKNDIDTFFDLLQQRIQIQKKIEQLGNCTYHKTDAGKALIASINPINVKIRSLAQSWLIRTRNKNHMVHSYDNPDIMSLGFILNRKM